MAHKTNLSLSLIALLLCIPTMHGMQQRKVSASSPSTVAPAAAVSPYEKLEQLNSQVTSAEDQLKQKKTDYYNNNRFGCLAGENAQCCAELTAAAGGVHLCPLIACPSLHGECDSAFNLPYGSTFVCSLITTFFPLACAALCNHAVEKATEAERTELNSVRLERDRLTLEIHAAETNRLNEHKRRIRRGE